MSSRFRRGVVACSFCRRRKRRCDGRLPRCKTCREKGLECTYDEPAPTRINNALGDELQMQRLDQVEERLKEHSVILDALSHQRRKSTSPSPVDSIPNIPAPSFPTPINTRSYNDVLSVTPQAPNQSGKTRDTDLPPPFIIPLGHQTSISHLLLLPQARHLLGDYPPEFLFHVEDTRPKSSAMQFMATDVKATSIPRPDLIDKDLADTYFEAFIALVHRFHPFLLKEELLYEYEDIMRRGLTSDKQSAVFWAIFGLGATASDPMDRSQSNYSGDAYIQKALRILFASWTLSFSGDVAVAEGLVLCAMYFTYIVEPLMAWRLVHMASVNIQQISARGQETLSDETEIQRITRLSWVCFTVECDILAEFHQPRSGIELLVDKMAFPTYGEPSTPETLFTLAEISARSLLNRIHHSIYFTDNVSIYTGRATNSPSSQSETCINPDASLLRICEELSRQLETWYQSLPEVIKPDLSGEQTINPQAALLRLRYLSAKQNIYRPFVTYITSQRPNQLVGISPSVLEMCEICLDACRMFILAARHILSERTPYTYSATQCCLSAVLVLSIAAQCHSLRGFVQDIEILQHCTTELLKPWSQDGSSIECGYEIAKSLARKQRFVK